MTSRFVAPQVISSTVPAEAVLTLRAAPNQTANIQEWRDASNGRVMHVSPAGSLSLNNSSGDYMYRFETSSGIFRINDGLTILRFLWGVTDVGGVGTLANNTWAFIAYDAARTGVIVRGKASQTANLQEWQNSAGTALTFVNSIGSIRIATTATGNAFAVSTANAGAAAIGILVRGTTSQTANLQEWQDSAGTVLAKIEPNGAIHGTAYINAFGTSEAYFLANHSSGTSGKRAYRVGSTQSSFRIQLLNDALVSITSEGFSLNGTLATINNTINANQTEAQLLINVSSTTTKGLVVKAIASQTANLQEWQNSSATVLAKVDATGNFTAVSKSFDIEHPTKSGMRLRYGSLEGPENGVYVRGITTDNVVELPDYWTSLVDVDSITAVLTSVGKFQNIFVEKIENNKVYVGGDVEKISYIVYGERKDIDKLTVEY